MIPEVSVIMSVYNAESYLREALESILEQTFKNFEFIIINDGSTDKSKEIIESYHDSRIILHEQVNKGLASSLNTGICMSKAEIIARMDADDISMQDRLEKQFKFLLANTNHIIVGSNAKIIDHDGNYIYTSDLPITIGDILKTFPYSPFFHSSVMFRKKAFYNAGGYDENVSKYNCFEDSLLWNKMKSQGMMANIEEPLINYRLLPFASSTKTGKESNLIKKIFKDIVANGEINIKNLQKLREIKESVRKKDRLYNYHILLAKKFIWNNHSRKSARTNLIKALKINPFNLNTILLMIITFLPKEFTLKMYNVKKQGL